MMLKYLCQRSFRFRFGKSDFLYFLYGLSTNYFELQHWKAAVDGDRRGYWGNMALRKWRAWFAGHDEFNLLLWKCVETVVANRSCVIGTPNYFFHLSIRVPGLNIATGRAILRTLLLIKSRYWIRLAQIISSTLLPLSTSPKLRASEFSSPALRSWSTLIVVVFLIGRFCKGNSMWSLLLVFSSTSVLCPICCAGVLLLGAPSLLTMVMFPLCERRERYDEMEVVTSL